jgi:DNA-binding response OmpR family regulator
LEDPFDSILGTVGPAPVKQVLIVEDEPLIGMNLKDCLEHAGAHAVWVQSDRAAYIALNGSKRPFDVAILDIDLGRGTTGFDIARHARKLYPEIGVIFSSGSPPDWINAFGVDGALFVPKPCTPAALLSAVGLASVGDNIRNVIQAAE